MHCDNDLQAAHPAADHSEQSWEARAEIAHLFVASFRNSSAPKIQNPPNSSLNGLCGRLMALSRMEEQKEGVGVENDGSRAFGNRFK
jgi:hypothetical protein